MSDKTFKDYYCRINLEHSTYMFANIGAVSTTTSSPPITSFDFKSAMQTLMTTSESLTPFDFGTSMLDLKTEFVSKIHRPLVSNHRNLFKKKIQSFVPKTTVPQPSLTFPLMKEVEIADYHRKQRLRLISSFSQQVETFNPFQSLVGKPMYRHYRFN